MGGIGAEVEVLADIAEDEVRAAVAVEVGYGEGFPPAGRLAEVGGISVKWSPVKRKMRAPSIRR